MLVFEGIVEAVSFKKNGWSLKVGEDWYAGRGSDHPRKGDEVKGEYEDKQWNDVIFHNIKRLDVVAVGEQPQVKSGDVGDKIVRQACLKAAAPIVAAMITKYDTDVNAAQVLTVQTAEAFKKYVDGGVQDL